MWDSEPLANARADVLLNVVEQLGWWAFSPQVQLNMPSDLLWEVCLLTCGRSIQSGGNRVVRGL
jgi:hypothetical protein